MSGKRKDVLDNGVVVRRQNATYEARCTSCGWTSTVTDAGVGPLAGDHAALRGHIVKVWREGMTVYDGTGIGT